MFRLYDGNFKNLKKKILDAQLKISQFLQERKKQYQRIVEQRESVSCPDCGQQHNYKYYGENATKPNDIEVRDRHYDNRVEINFLECSQCNKLFGVKTIFYHEPSPSLSRSSFRIIGK